EVCFPGETAFVGAALIECFHIRIKTGNHLNHIEVFGNAVLCQSLEFFWPLQPFTERHVPGIGKPKEGSAVSMFEMIFIFRDPDGAMQVKYIGADVGFYFHLSRHSME